MNRSSKIIVASCVCAAFLAVGIGCTVEDRDVEEKGVFLCKDDGDCLDGSKCVKVKKGDDIIGRCTREDEIQRCVDMDGDGFLYSEPQYDFECGYTESRPKDADDSDPMVYFGATEICDDKDNSGDGCKDSICPEGKDCKCPDVSGKPDYTCDKNKLCKPIIKPCWGSGSVDNYDKSVCSADKIGALKCIDGEEKFVKRDASGNYNVVDGGACPKSTAEIAGYVDIEQGPTCGDGIDNNCNTLVDEGCVSCQAEIKTKNPICYVTSAGNGDATEADKADPNSNYSNIMDKCGDKSNCKCIGTYKCFGENESPRCADASGNEITSDSIGSDPCFGTFD